MRNSFDCCPWMKALACVALGVALGYWGPAWFSSDRSIAAQEKAVEKKGGNTPEERLRELKIDLPKVSKPTNTLWNAVRVGDMLYVSGTGPGKGVVGRLGENYDVKQGQLAARQVGLQILAVVKTELGSLDKVERLVKTLGMVNATPEFKDHPKVINGFSDLMAEIFGPELGVGARSAVGMASLPGGIPVEIECIFQVRK